MYTPMPRRNGLVPKNDRGNVLVPPLAPDLPVVGFHRVFRVYDKKGFMVSGLCTSAAGHMLLKCE